MANSKKKYWTGLNDLDNTEQFKNSAENEFPEELPVDRFLSENKLSETSTGRRDFLKFLGFGVTAATVAACETPVNKIIPYVNQPPRITPGVPDYYASSYYDGNDVASIFVKTREGRPIHLKGNKYFGSNKGAINARINASVLMLYDGQRQQYPEINGEKAQWSTVDSQVKQGLQSAADEGKQIALLTDTIISPSAKKVIEGFKKQYGGENGEGVNHVTYDTISYSGIREANKATLGKAIIPTYNFAKAKAIVGIGANFLDDWLMSTDYSAEYGQNRHPDGDWMSRHIHFEGTMSLTGANADKRVPIKPSHQGAVAVGIYNAVAKKTGNSTLPATSEKMPDTQIDEAAELLVNNRQSALLVCGSNNADIQKVVNGINQMVGSYGSTIDTDTEVYINQGNEAEVEQLVVDMNAGKVGALLVGGGNPAYSLPRAKSFNEGLKKVDTTVGLSLYADETASRCKFMCPVNHYLESWNDHEAKKGSILLAQPVIRPLYSTRQMEESLLKWSGNDKSYHDFIKSQWMSLGGISDAEPGIFRDFWENALRQGGHERSKSNGPGNSLTFNGSSLSGAANHIRSAVKENKGGFEVELYTKTGIGDGSHANNPWLQEFPDPVSRVSWDNYIAMSPLDVNEMGLNRNLGQHDPASVAKIKVNGVTLKLPVLPQPGQKKGTVAVALGYGRGENGEKIGKAAYRNKFDPGFNFHDKSAHIPVGANAYPLVGMDGGQYQYVHTGAEITPVDETMYLVSVQVHHTIMDRESVLKETDLDTYRHEPKEDYNPVPTLEGHEDGKKVEKPATDYDLWQSHLVDGVGHHWGMSIDLSTCIGCGACVTACQSENNGPVVGKDEVRRARDMYWIRIDRYYSAEIETLKKAEKEGLGRIDGYHEMGTPDADHPRTTFMPVMCQHCNHAPCETVCPVAATTHSNEGLNMMTYNRCIGTRYCANNCPYKVRRFNWFNYKAYEKFEDINPSQDVTMRMVLNPDVTVRSRGVMEKCSMCVQRIQQGKLEAKMEEHPVKDGAIQTACADACPTRAITFGDLNDDKSKVRKEQNDNRSYFALEEIGTRPSVGYQLKVRNENKA